MKRNTLHIIVLLLVIAVATLQSCTAKAQDPAAWAEKDVVALGDSNTSIGGDTCQRPTAWTYWFCLKAHPRTMRSYARSGATWTNTPQTRLDTESYTEVLADHNVIYNQVERLIQAHRAGTQPAPHLVMIAAGTNDAWFQKRRPQLFSKTVEEAFRKPLGEFLKQKPSQVVSLAESVRYSVELLHRAFPNARIILLTPMQTTQASYADTERVGNIIQQVGERLSVPVIRQDHITAVCRDHEAQMPRLTTDGTHTSPEGARQNGFLLVRQVESLINW